jgi:hypothetical protein
MSNYMYAQTIIDRGYVRVFNYTKVEQEKMEYVRDYLWSALHYSKCGWNAVDYRVMETPSGHRTEFLVLWADAVGASGSRWINVTGESLGSVMCSMCDNLW